MNRQYTREQIEQLIPQRAPIKMIDSVVSVDNLIVQTALLVQDTNWFFSDGHLLEAGLVEHIAQSAAAMMGLKNEGAPKVGYIGDIKNFTVSRLPRLGELIRSRVTAIAQLESVTMVEADSKIDNELVATARMKVFLAE